MAKQLTYTTTNVEHITTNGRGEHREYINLNDPCEPTQPCGEKKQ